MSKNCQIMSRMKQNYESRSAQYLTRRIPVVMRIDGKAFHTYTSNLDKPFDNGLIDDMNNTAIYLCQNIQGAKCAYVQSDEISILITDYDKLQTDAWFDYNIQKMCSVSAGYAAGKFNQLRLKRKWGNRDENYISEEDLWRSTIANFDSRVFNIPKEEVSSYFLARQRDCVKNSISSVAQSLYSHKELEGKNSNDKQEMIFQKGLNWNDFPIGQKRGRVIVKQIYCNDVLIRDHLYMENDKLCFKGLPTPAQMEMLNIINDTPTIRTKWEVVEIPETFTQEHFKSFL